MRADRRALEPVAGDHAPDRLQQLLAALVVVDVLGHQPADLSAPVAVRRLGAGTRAPRRRRARRRRSRGRACSARRSRSPARAASSISQPAQRATITPAQNASPQPVVSTTGASWAGSVALAVVVDDQAAVGAALDDHAARRRGRAAARGGRCESASPATASASPSLGMKMSTWGRQRREQVAASSPRTPRKSAVVSAPVLAGVAQDLAGAARRRCRAARSGRRGARRRSRSITSHGDVVERRTCCWRPARATPGGCRRGGSAGSWPTSARRPCATSVRRVDALALERADEEVADQVAADRADGDDARAEAGQVDDRPAGGAGRCDADLVEDPALLAARQLRRPGARGRRRCRCRRTRPAGARRAARRSWSR